MDTTRTVGNDVLFRRVATGERLPTTNQAPGLTLANTTVMNETKMHASTGPIQANFNGKSPNDIFSLHSFQASYGPSQYDLPPPPKLNGNLIRCSGCGRVNNPDSRYCDWCGALPGAQETWETVPFPIRPKPMQPTPRAVPTLVTRNGSTQTVGLFYPGGHRIQKESDEIFQKMERQTTALANSKAMSAISPGNGKWNQQIDHINQHLKTYAQQNKAFREAISEPRLEKIIGAEIHDEEDVIQVRMTFPIARDAKGKYVPRKEMPKKVAFGSTTFEEPRKPKKTKKEEIPAEERILLNELKKKRCNLERVEECLAAGADPNIKDEHGTPALSIAVSNYHFEAAKQIIETKNFSITYRSTEDQNTFLHLAVMAGESPESIYLVDLLLQKGATERKNKAGELPSDIARKYRYTKFLELLEPELVSSKASKAASKAATPSTKSTPRGTASNSKSPTPNSRPPSSHSQTKPASEKSSTYSRSSVSEKSNKPKSARSGSVSSTRSRPMSNRSSVLDGF